MVAQPLLFRRSLSFLLLVLAGLALIAVQACDILGPDDGLRVSIEELRLTIYGRDQEAAVSGEDVVTVSGVTPKAAPCYELGARVNVTNDLLGDDLLTVRIGAEYSRPRCGTTVPDVIAWADYRAEIAGLRPGRYRVNVVHQQSWNTTNPDTVITREVVQVQ